jgi:hypothetical protein
VEDVYVSDKQLNQDGPTKIFTPMPNSVNVEWAWVNLKERQPQPIGFKLKMMTLPEINAVNNFLDNQQDIVKDVITAVAGGQIDGKTSSSAIGAFFEALMFALVLSFLAVVGMNLLERYESADQQGKGKMNPMESHNEEESEMRNLRTRSTYLR